MNNATETGQLFDAENRRARKSRDRVYLVIVTLFISVVLIVALFPEQSIDYVVGGPAFLINSKKSGIPSYCGVDDVTSLDYAFTNNVSRSCFGFRLRQGCKPAIIEERSEIKTTKKEIIGREGSACLVRYTYQDANDLIADGQSKICRVSGQRNLVSACEGLAATFNDNNSFYHFGDKVGLGNKIIYQKVVASKELVDSNGAESSYQRVRLYATDSDGKNAVGIVDIGKDYYSPSNILLVPEKKSLIVSIEKDLYLFDMVNQGVDKIYTNENGEFLEGDIQISPNGNLLAFNFQTDKNSQYNSIGLINLDQPSEIKVLYRSDNNSQAYASGWRDNNTLLVRAGSLSCPTDISLLDVESKSLQSTGINTHCSDYRLNKDGSNIAVAMLAQRGQDGGYAYTTTAEAGNVFANAIILSDGKSVRLIQTDENYFYQPLAWSPDGKLVYFNKEKMSKDETGMFQPVADSSKTYKYNIDSASISDVVAFTNAGQKPVDYFPDYYDETRYQKLGLRIDQGEKLVGEIF